MTSPIRNQCYIYIFIMCSIGCTELNLVYKRDVNGDLESVIYASELDEVKWHASGTNSKRPSPFTLMQVCCEFDAL